MLCDPNALAFERIVASHLWLIGVRPGCGNYPRHAPLDCRPTSRWRTGSISALPATPRRMAALSARSIRRVTMRGVERPDGLSDESWRELRSAGALSFVLCCLASACRGRSKRQPAVHGRAKPLDRSGRKNEARA